MVILSRLSLFGRIHGGSLLFKSALGMMPPAAVSPCHQVVEPYGPHLRRDKGPILGNLNLLTTF